MTQSQAVSQKTVVPIIRHLHLPEKAGEEPYLEGTRCRTCGETYLGPRRVCVKCYGRDVESVALSRTGELFTYTIVYQSAPGTTVPYIAVVVKLPEGPFISANLEGCELNPAALRAGMKVEMFTEKVREDRYGNDIIAYKFRPLKGE